MSSVKAGVMPCPLDFQNVKMKIETSGRNRKTTSHSVAGATNIGTGKPGSRRYLRCASASGCAAGAPPISPRGAVSACVNLE